MALNKAKRQELFERGVRGVFAQGAYGFDQRNGNCTYYEVIHNRRCVVGHMLDAVKAAELQQTRPGTVEALFGHAEGKEFLKEIGVTTKADMRFLTNLQEHHDRLAQSAPNHSFEPEEFAKEMSVFAIRNQLDFTFIDNLILAHRKAQTA